MDSYLIVLVNYNNWLDTIECVQSLLNAEVDHSNILIIENGSKNESYNQLRNSFPDINIIPSIHNLGFSGGNNLGINYGLTKKVEYIILLNNDTMVEKNSIKLLLDGMKEYSDVSLGTGQIRCYPAKEKIWYAGGKIILWRGLALHSMFLKKVSSIKIIQPEPTEFISGCYMCIKTSHVDRLGFFNEKFFLYLEDIEYSARAINKGLKLMYFPKSIIYHKWRGETDLKYETLYYAVRNRKLLIDLAFPIIAKFYFQIIIMIKMSFWFFINKKFFIAAKKGLFDYRKGYFGQINSNESNN